MGARELFALAGNAVAAHRLRSALTMLGILIGIASVILLTSIGEGTRQYILSEFTQFGTIIIAVNPGKTMTTGQPGALGGTSQCSCTAQPSWAAAARRRAPTGQEGACVQRSALAYVPSVPPESSECLRSRHPAHEPPWLAR